MDAPQPAQLPKRQLSVATVVFMIFCLCAAGAYGIEDMIPQSGPGLTLVMLFVLPFLWSTPMALVAAELGSALPEEGGFYKWVQRACGEFWGFQAGWWRTLSIYFDNTIYVVLAGSYVASVVEMTAMESYLFKATIIIFFTYINLRGIQDVGVASSILSIVVMAAFALVAAVGFANWQTNPFVPFTPPDQSLLQSIGAGIAIGVWMYAGYESMSTVAGELKDPQVIPKATLISVPLIMAAYILPTMGGIASLGSWADWSSDNGVSYGDVVGEVAPALGVAFVMVAVLAQFSVFNAYIASGSRGFFALAADNLAPKTLAKVSEKTGVPYVAVLSLGVFSLIMCMFPFETIVIIDVMLLISAYVLIFVAACIIRIKEPSLNRPFKIPVGAAGLIAMCVPPVIIAFGVLFTSGADYLLAGMIGLLSGPIAYVGFRKTYGGLSKSDPERYPANPATGLRYGDLFRLFFFCAGLATIGAVALVFLPGFEDPAYYAEEYGLPGLLDAILRVLRWFTGALAVAALLLLIGAVAIDRKPTGER